MVRLPLGMSLDTLVDAVRDKYALLSACDAGTKLEGTGWRMKNAIWVFEKGGEDDVIGVLDLQAHKMFIDDIKECIDLVKPKKEQQ